MTSVISQGTWNMYELNYNFRQLVRTHMGGLLLFFVFLTINHALSYMQAKQLSYTLDFCLN